MKYSQNFWVKDHRQIYLLGNPMIWFLSTAAVAGYIAVRGLLILRAQRGYRDFENSK
jgi:dolichyl-phosphate-mannose-protein mannosyltransferase